MKNGKLSKREMQTLSTAWGILTRWVDWKEEHAENEFELFEDYDYSNAAAAVVSLCEFVTAHED